MGLKSWGEGYRRSIVKTIGKDIAHFKKGDSYTPRKFLKKHGFKKVKVRKWRKSEIYTIKSALEYVQSVSVWNSVPLSLRKSALEGLKKYFTDLKKRRGKIERKLDVKVVVGSCANDGLK